MCFCVCVCVSARSLSFLPNIIHKMLNSFDSTHLSFFSFFFFFLAFSFAFLATKPAVQKWQPLLSLLLSLAFSGSFFFYLVLIIIVAHSRHISLCPANLKTTRTTTGRFNQHQLCVCVFVKLPLVAFRAGAFTAGKCANSRVVVVVVLSSCSSSLLWSLLVSLFIPFFRVLTL